MSGVTGSSALAGSTGSSVSIDAAFGERPTLALAVPRFSDRQVTDAIGTLDRLLADEKDPAKWPASADTALWNFGRHLQTGRLSSAQEALVLKHVDTIAKTRPDQAPMFDRARFMVSALGVGKTAPDIVGKDLDGVEFKLSDYRGKVVVLNFSAEWCGICRTLFPYERLMLDLYKNWPFAIVGVETGSSPAVAKQIKADAGVPFRAFWDTPGATPRGPIATAWNVGGYPALYVIDGRGTIRFVDLRYEDLLKSVRQLLAEDTTAPARPTEN